MIKRRIESPDDLHAVRAFLAERIEMDYTQDRPDAYHVTIRYRGLSITFDQACLESGFPIPTPYSAISWLHTMCMVAMRKNKEEFGKTWHLGGRELDREYQLAQDRLRQCIRMFGGGFASNWEG